jgi:REP element-mobilizing transposase RayT
MVRSISDVRLFTSSADKDMYLKLIKIYQATYLFKVYAYCLMDTHAHLLIDCNGADISKIMHAINQCYAQYYNRTHNRRGHLFQDRFKSNIIYDDSGLIRVSAYINKNPKDLKGYRGREEKYYYSSFGIYIGLRRDPLGILDPYFILNQFSKDIICARKFYLEFVRKFDEEDNTNDMEFRHERAEYRSERTILVRNITPCQIVDFVSSYTKKDKACISIKYIKDASDLKALSALLMRCLCDMNEKVICKEMGNITQSHAARLYIKGYRLLEEKSEYENLIRDFLDKKAS